jgi:Fe-S-cluster containining protein
MALSGGRQDDSEDPRLKVLAEICDVVAEDFGGRVSNLRKFLTTSHETTRRLRATLECLQSVARELYVHQRILVSFLAGTDGARLKDMLEHDKDGVILGLLNESPATRRGLGIQVRGTRRVPEPTLVNCDERLKICKGACCSLSFALSQDEIVNKGIGWNRSLPFRIRKAEDGYCAFFDKSTLRCTIYENRPEVCRRFSCRNRKDIWQDFENMVPSERLLRRLKRLWPDDEPVDDTG